MALSAIESLESDSAAIAFPDPVLTANLYCAGRLDEVIRQVVAPFRQQLRQDAAGGSGYLWVVRYGRGGEHLKVRLHAASARRQWAKSLLENLSQECFSSLDFSAARSSPKERLSPPPPLDPEDDVESEYPYPALLWTQYRRSQVSLAAKPLLLDDRYVSLSTLCLGRGCDLVLEALAEVLSPRLRALCQLQALIGGLAALDLSPASRRAYLAFHRDCLVRSLLVRRGASPRKVIDLVARFDRQQQEMAALLVPLRQVAEAEWDGEADRSAADEGADSAWRSSLVALHRYVSLFREDPEYRLDPLAEDPTFPLLFKAFHGFANQLGLNHVDEAFCHHLLVGLTRAPEEAAPPVRLFDLEEVSRQAPIPMGDRVPDRSLQFPIGSLSPTGGGPGAAPSWFHFVSRSGAQGKEWLIEYLAESRTSLPNAIELALQQLRRQRIREGKDLLDEVERELQRLEGVPPSVVLVMERFFWSTAAYYYYCVEELDLAGQALERAHQAVVDAIEHAPFLLPLAIHCHEFRLQHARIARYRRRWTEMRSCLQEVRGMLENEIPLCVLSGHRPLYLSTLVDFHRGIPLLETGEVEALRFFFDREHRTEAMNQVFMNLYAIPGSVTPYP